MFTFDSKQEDGVLSIFFVLFDAGNDWLQYIFLLKCDFVKLMLVASH